MMYNSIDTCNLSSISAISAISNIPRKSRTNNSTHSSCSNLSEIGKPISESAKINKAINSCDESITEYAKLKLIHECLKEIANSKDLPVDKTILNKLDQLLTLHEVKKFIHLPNQSKDLKEELTLLGITNLPDVDFSYEEQLTIKSCLEAKLREKIHSFITIYENLAGSTKELLKNNESKLRSRYHQRTEIDNLHWKNKIEEVYLEYMKDLSNVQKMLSQLEVLQVKMNEKIVKDIETLSLQAQVAELKANITKLSCTVRMYTELPITAEALRIVNACLDEKMASVNEEIIKKRDLKKAYDSLKNTEYDEILKKYLELCYVIKKKNSLLEKL